MKIAMLVELGAHEYLDAHLAFHLNAAVDVVLISPDARDEPVSRILERYAREGLVVRLVAPGGVSGSERRDLAAHVAATEHGAEWLIESAVNEFWWPRAADLKDVLVAVPPRYGTVQALIRDFVPRAGAGLFAERMITRTSLADAYPGTEPRLHLLRSIFRLVPGAGVHGGQPLRAWYPVEVLRFPDDSVASDEKVESLGLVGDERLRDALRALTDGSTYRLPVVGQSRFAFPVPSVVDDAEYAVECAAVGEVDLDRLDRHIRELEARIAWLEQRLWPRVLRRVSHLARGRIRPPG